MTIIKFPILYVPDPLKNRPLGGGQIFVGEPDLDPAIEINQKQLRIVQEDGTKVDVIQPFELSFGGVPTYNGATVRLDVDGAFSMKILDKNGVQKYYIENVYEGEPITSDSLSQTYIFDTVADTASNAIVFPEEKRVYIKERKAYFIFKLGGTPNGKTILDAGNGNTLEIEDKYKVNVQAIGAKGDDSTDNKDFIPEVIAITEGSSLFEDGVYYTSESLNEDSAELAAGKVVIKGDRKKYSKIKADVNNALHIRDNARLIDFTLEGDISSDWGSDSGPAVRTTDTGLHAYGQMDNMEVNGYRMGAFIRNSVNVSFKDLNWRSNGCHVMLARAPYVTSGNPISTGTWNQANGQGFFQNIVGFKDCNFSFGEVGIMGTVLCGVFDNVSTQAQRANPSGNNFIPDLDKGTGIWLQGGYGFDNRRGAGANSIRGWYSEASDRGLYIKDQEYVDIKASFMQGGSSNSPSEFATIDNSIVHIQGCIKYDWFSPTIIKNNSTVYHSDATLGAGGSVDVDQSSKYRPRGEVDRCKFDYYLITDGSSGDSFLLQDAIADNGFAELKITILYDGVIAEAYIADVARWSNGASVITWRGTDPSSDRFTVTDASNGILRITSTAVSTWQGNFLLTLNGGPDISGNQITLNAE